MFTGLGETDTDTERGAVHELVVQDALQFAGHDPLALPASHCSVPSFTPLPQT